MRKKIIWLFIVLFLLLPLWLWLAWLYTTPKKLNIAIIDKTVLTDNVQEHISFDWLLTNKKYTRKDGNFYLPTTDYFGFFPLPKKKYILRGLERFTSAQIDSIAGALDMAYFTDTYGIYRNEWDNTNVMEHSGSLYGGMSAEDIELLSVLKARKKLIIAEFNTVASPTPANIRIEFEKLFGMQWTGWAGRYFDLLDTSLNKELPEWLKNGYVSQHNNTWPFKKSGIAFVNESGEIEILENDRDLNYEYPVIRSGETSVGRFGIHDRVPYPYWFDIMKTSRNNNIISFYEIDTNKRGDSVLQRNGIPKQFPAVIERTGDCKFYYFSGDYADNPITMRLAKFKYVDILAAPFTSNKGTSKNYFFWRFYAPLVSKIMEENF